MNPLSPSDKQAPTQVIHLQATILSRFFNLLRFYGVDRSKEVPVWLYAHKALTQSKEASKKSDSVGDNVVKLGTGESKEIKKKWMWGK